MLYLCATPIGNLEDITLRVLRVLSHVEAVYAEDTRHSAQLLSHYEIKKPLISCHEHNEAQRAREIAERIKNGEDIAYISDAGMPCISDPGARLVSVCIRENLPFTVLPGATACATALALSGLPSERFLFMGFLPRSGKERRQAVEKICAAEESVIIYESPNRVYATLSEFCECMGKDRQAALVREITKLYEQAKRGTLFELCEEYRDAPPKGECVIIVEGREKQNVSDADVDAYITELLSEDMRAKDIARRVAEKLGVPKNDVYRRVLELSGGEK